MKIFFHYSCYVVSIDFEMKALKGVSIEWYDDASHLHALLEDHYKLLFTSSTSLYRYWGKHKIFQAEIENRISAFKQKGARE